MAKARSVLTFNEDDSRAAPLLAPVAAPPAAADQQTIQIGTRVPAAVYRQIKILAAQQGVTIATLVAQALSDLLAKSANGAR